MADLFHGNWLIIQEVENPEHGGGILFSLPSRWYESETDQTLQPVQYLFHTQDGSWQFQGGRTRLLSGATEIAILEGLNPNNVDLGSNGQGRCNETGHAFNWTVHVFGDVAADITVSATQGRILNKLSDKEKAQLLPGHGNTE
jgi:hypothetical protein